MGLTISSIVWMYMLNYMTMPATSATMLTGILTYMKPSKTSIRLPGSLGDSGENNGQGCRCSPVLSCSPPFML